MREIVIRLHCPNGKVQLTIDPGEPWKELMTKAGGMLELRNPILFRDVLDSSGRSKGIGEMYTVDIATSIASAGIKHGDRIHVVGDSVKDPNSRSSIFRPSSSSGYSYFPKIPSSSSASSSSNKANSTSETNREPEGEKKCPIHVAFDAFLKSRRYETSSLAGTLKYSGVIVEKGKMNKLPTSVTLQRQKYRHVDYLEYMNLGEMINFVRYWSDRGMIENRVGWMYGYYCDDPSIEEGCRGVMEGIYEPPQVSVDGTFKLLDDPFRETVDRVASGLGLERIGWIFTQFPKDENVLLTSVEVDKIGQQQLEHQTDKHFTEYTLSKFITCTVHPNPKLDGFPDTSAFMVSDQCIAMMRDGLMAEPTNPRFCSIREPDEEREILPAVLESGEDSKEIDPDWFVVRVNDGSSQVPKSIFRRTKFPVENRGNGSVIPTRASMKRYFQRMGGLRKIGPKNWEQFADFHLLLFIARDLDIDTALSLSHAVSNHTSVGEGVLDMFEAILETEV